MLIKKTVGLAALALTSWLASASASTVFINEFHYDNMGQDVGEFVEVAGLAGTDLTGWTIVFYNGSNGTAYNTLNLSGVLTDQSNGYGFWSMVLPQNSLQNGAPDGIVLLDNLMNVVEAISYEGTFTATNGPAAGTTTTNVGVSQNSGTPIGTSIARIGTGSVASDFVWASLSPQTVGSVNVFQAFENAQPVPIPAAGALFAAGFAGLVRNRTKKRRVA